MSTPENEHEGRTIKTGIINTGSGSEKISTTNTSGGHDKFKLLIFVVLGVIVAVAGYFLFRLPHGDQTGKGGRANGKNHAIPVTVATATIQSVPIEIRSIGNVMPYSVVNVVPQANGQLTKVTFTQGQFVNKGDLLFQIDPRPYQAALDQALGNVAKDKAGVDAARANMQKDMAEIGLLQANQAKDVASAKYATTEQSRYASLVQQGAVSHEQSDQMTTNAKTADATIEADKKAVENARQVVNADKAAIATAQGTLQADQAAADNARIQLGFCQIRSPIDGRTGSLNVYEGNIVQANQTTPLVTIDQIQPIYIQFTLPEKDLDQIRQCIANNTLKVEAMIEGQKTRSVHGTVSFMQNTVDTTSGTVVMRAMFHNRHKRLYPGQFVDIVVTMPAPGQTVVVPQTALQTSQQGNSVYIVQPDSTVNFVSVQLDRTFGTMAAIGGGLKAGDVVVTDGQLQLTPGAKVEIQKNSSGPKDKDTNAGAPPSEDE